LTGKIPIRPDAKKAGRSETGFSDKKYNLDKIVGLAE
jgi:hypothetical protein